MAEQLHNKKKLFTESTVAKVSLGSRPFSLTYSDNLLKSRPICTILRIDKNLLFDRNGIGLVKYIQTHVQFAFMVLCDNCCCKNES